MTSAQRFPVIVLSAAAVSSLVPTLSLLIVEVLLAAFVLAVPVLPRWGTAARATRNRAQGALRDAEWALIVAQTRVAQRGVRR